MKLNVANIQHFSTGDGPGIRTTLFLKGCNLHCPWCHNPETVSPLPEELFFAASGKRVRYGREMTVEELLPELLEDAEFYRASGGGITASGGEPLLQSRALSLLGEKLQESGISLIVDTAGDVPWESFARLLPYTEEFFFDVKTGSLSAYRDTVGGDGRRIYENLRRLTALSAPVHIRIPLIPDFNTDSNAVREICRLLRGLGIGRVDLLPFHRLGSGKYTALGRPYAYRETEPLSEKTLADIASIYREYFETVIEK